MRRLGQKVACAVVSLSLIAGPTAAAASAPAPQVAPASDGWLTLSMLTPSGSAVLGSTGLAAVQPEAPPPGMQTCADGSVIPATATCAPPPPPGYAGPSTPPLPVILVWLAVLGVDVYILTKNHHHHPVPNSPA